MGLGYVPHFVQTLSCDSLSLLAQTNHALPALREYFLASCGVLGKSPAFLSRQSLLLDPSHFHAAMCSQSQSLCLLGEWCKAHLLVQADRKKAALKDGSWVAYFFRRFQCPCLTNESPEAVWVVISSWEQLSAVLLWLFSPWIQNFSSRFLTQIYFKASSIITYF